MTNYIGIDYGRGETNIDKLTGIRFGVINQGEVGQAWFESAEADYGKPTCPKCGNEAIELESNQSFLKTWKSGNMPSMSVPIMLVSIVSMYSVPNQPLAMNQTDFTLKMANIKPFNLAMAIYSLKNPHTLPMHNSARLVLLVRFISWSR